MDLLFEFSYKNPSSGSPSRFYMDISTIQAMSDLKMRESQHMVYTSVYDIRHPDAAVAKPQISYQLIGGESTGEFSVQFALQPETRLFTHKGFQFDDSTVWPRLDEFVTVFDLPQELLKKKEDFDKYVAWLNTRDDQFASARDFELEYVRLYQAWKAFLALKSKKMFS